jgi:hypothetical protein
MPASRPGLPRRAARELRVNVIHHAIDRGFVSFDRSRFAPRRGERCKVSAHLEDHGE